MSLARCFFYAAVVQEAERCTCNAYVGGSIPSSGSNVGAMMRTLYCGRITANSNIFIVGLQWQELRKE